MHRDVKPGNVLIGERRHLPSSPTWASRPPSEATRITVSGTVLGTAAYMAPEQLDGEHAGPAADVYSLAAVAFEALAGRKARQGATPMEIAHRAATEPPPDLRDAWPGAPPGAAEALRARHGARARRLGPHPRESLRRRSSAAWPRSARARRCWPRGRRRGAVARPRGCRRPRRWPRSRWSARAAIVALGGGGDDGGSQPARKPAAKRRGRRAPGRQARGRSARLRRRPPPAEAPVTEGARGRPGGARTSAGFELMSQGRYDEAIPMLQRAVERSARSPGDLTYAYALYNLGRALRLAGRADEAVPILERRLRIPNQRRSVKKELKQAQKAAR